MWLRKVIPVLLLWLSANVVAVHMMDWHQRTALEREFGLRSGILHDFEEHEVGVEIGGGQRRKFRYRVSPPSRRGNKDQRFPVVLCLHGSGERGFENAKQLRSVPALLTNTELRQSHACFVLVPQCPSEQNWTTFRRRGAARVAADDLILKMLDQVLQDPRADADRVYLVGFSMGAFGAWQLAADFPHVFAAVVPISGGASIELAKRLVDIPVWAVHGSNDQVCSIDETRAIIDAITAAGGQPRFTELPEIGHAAWKPIFQESHEVLNWMFAQRRSDIISRP